MDKHSRERQFAKTEYTGVNENKNNIFSKILSSKNEALTGRSVHIYIQQLFFVKKNKVDENFKEFNLLSLYGFKV